jgi:hypothetical protein
MQFGYHTVHISRMEEASRVTSSWLRRVVKPHLLWPITLNVLLHRVGYCAHHPSGFVIFIQLALLGILFIIYLIFPIPCLVGTGKIA